MKGIHYIYEKKVLCRQFQGKVSVQGIQCAPPALSRTVFSVYFIFSSSHMNRNNVVDIEKGKEIKKIGKYRRRNMWGKKGGGYKCKNRGSARDKTLKRAEDMEML